MERIIPIGTVAFMEAVGMAAGTLDEIEGRVVGGVHEAVDGTG